MQLYAITDRHLLSGDEQERRAALVEMARAWARRGVDYIQVREKDLAADELRALTAQIAAAVRGEGRNVRVLLNGPAAIALDAGAAGVHLPASLSSDAAEDARSLFARAGREAVVSHACHSREEVLRAKEEAQRNALASTANTLIVYAPVFEKVISRDGATEKLPGVGLEALKYAVEFARPISVFALGGVTRDNAPSCIAAGAAGIAGIRIFLS